MCLSEALAVCLASPMGLREPKDRLFHAISHAILSPNPSISHTWSSLAFFFFPLISLLLCHHQPPKTPSPPKLPFPSFPAGESPCIVVSSWIWKPHSEVKVREVWQQQSTLIEGGIKNSKSLCVSVERGPVTFCVLSVAGQETLWWGTKKLLLRLWLLGVLKFPLKSFPSL